MEKIAPIHPGAQARKGGAMITLAIGLFIGALVGFILAAILAAAKISGEYACRSFADWLSAGGLIR